MTKKNADSPNTLGGAKRRKRNRPPSVKVSEMLARDESVEDQATNSQYEIGYRKPPKHGRFKKGQSGNSKGRPRGSKSLAKFYVEERDTKVSVTENGKQRKIPKGQAIAKQVVNKAMTGDARARADVMKLEQQAEGGPSTAGRGKGAEFVAPEERDKRDMEIIEFFKARIKNGDA